MSDGYVVPLDVCDSEPRSLVGGKAAGLGSVSGLGLPIPVGFAVTTDAYRHAAGEELLAELERTLRRDEALAARAESARRLVAGLRPPPAVEEAVRAAYAELCERCGGAGDVAVAVRSSAAAEDTEGASFAGEYDTYLWIRGADGVVDAVVRCWSSLFGDRAVSYREHERIDAAPAMGVVVQQMVDADAAGVMFSLNPENGDRSKIAVEACFGLGELLVAGEITPDSFLLDKVTGEILRRRISTKTKKLVFDRERGHGVVEEAVQPEQQEQPSVSDAQLAELREYARTAERTLGFPVDMEWAVDARGVSVLQVRPETVWSRRGRETPSLAGNVVDNIVASLTRGVN